MIHRPVGKPKTKYLSGPALKSLMRFFTYLAAHSPALSISSKITNLICKVEGEKQLKSTIHFLWSTQNAPKTDFLNSWTVQYIPYTLDSDLEIYLDYGHINYKSVSSGSNWLVFSVYISRVSHELFCKISDTVSL